MTVIYRDFGYLEDTYLDRPYLEGGGGGLGAMGMQAQFVITAKKALGAQAEFVINDSQALGAQAEFVINDSQALGAQAQFIKLAARGMQANFALYNTTNLRFLCDFPSRGLEGAVGTNAWGNAMGQGLSWRASSTAPGEFSVHNLNTDIVEQSWRSAPTVVTGITLDNDTERPQGVFMDTFAILEHNLTSSASIILQETNDPTFSTIGNTIVLSASKEDHNIYYIAPDLPTSGYRYRRLQISDAGNPDGHIEIGTILFGASNIFFGECFVDEVEFNLKDFADEVSTEGFTNVSNSRAQKKNLKLEFRSLNFQQSNFKLMRGVFTHDRTVLKCLWIPTPSPTDMRITGRFALFAKMTQVPVERHKYIGGNADYVSFTLELDESR